MFDDAPPAPPDMPTTCLVVAAAAYEVPLDALLAIRLQEGGYEGARSENSNGTQDLGVMQINTIHTERIAEDLGISETDLVNDACANIFAAADIFRGHWLASDGDFWVSVGNYHSKTPKFHIRYVTQARSRYRGMRREYPDYHEWVHMQLEEVHDHLDGNYQPLGRPAVIHYGLSEDPEDPDSQGVNRAFAKKQSKGNPYLSTKENERIAAKRAHDEPREVDEEVQAILERAESLAEGARDEVASKRESFVRSNGAGRDRSNVSYPNYVNFAGD